MMKNDLVQAIHKYFNGSYQEIPVKVGVDESDNRTSTIYAWISESGKNSYVAIYHDGVDMDKQNYKPGENHLQRLVIIQKVIGISGPVTEDTDDGNQLLDALGGDFAKKYKKAGTVF